MEKLTCQERILSAMISNPTKTQWLVSDISSFIGYEAGTRIGDLCRRGLVERTGTHIVYEDDGVTVRNRFAIYSLTK